MRLRFPDPSSALVYVPGATAYTPLSGAAGLTVTIYAAATGSTLADIQDVNGTPVSGSTLVVDANSLLPEFLGPDGADTVYAAVGSGTRVPVYAQVDARLDAEILARASGDAEIDARVDSEIAARVAGDEQVEAASEPRIDRTGAVTGQVVALAGDGSLEFGNAGGALPDGFTSTDDRTAVPGSTVTDGSTTTGWAGPGISSLALDTELKTFGPSSVSFWINVYTSTNKVYYNLPSPITVDDNTVLLIDVAYRRVAGDSYPWEGLRLRAGSATALTGTTAAAKFPPMQERHFVTVALPTTGLTTVASIGFSNDAGKTSTGLSDAHNLWVGGIRVASKTELDLAISNGSSSLTAAGYTPSVTEDIVRPRSSKALVDLRPGRQVVTGLGAVRDVREWGVPEDGVTDALSALSRAISDLNPGDTLRFSANGKYLLSNGALTLQGLKNVTIDGNGASLFTRRFRGWVTNAHGNANNGSDPIIDLSDSNNITLRNLRVFGAHDRVTPGSALISDSGTPALAATYSTTLAYSAVANSPALSRYAPTITVASAAGAPATPFDAVVNNKEIVSVTSIAGSVLTATRARGGTEGYNAAHNNPLVVGTATLTTQGDSVRNKENDEGITAPVPFARYPLVMFPSAIRTQIAAFDPKFAFGHAFTINVHDSAQVAGDVLMEVVGIDAVAGPTLASNPTASSTQFTLSADTSATEEFYVIDSEIVRVASKQGTQLNVQRGVNGSTAAAHTAGAVLRPVVAARAITATATPTDYVLPWEPVDLHRIVRVKVRKNTATANTITVNRMIEYGTVEYEASHDSANAITVRDCRDLLIEDMLIEGAATDAIDVTSAGNKGVTVRRIHSRAANRQGISFNLGTDILFEDSEVAETGRSGIDVEPYAETWLVRNVTIRNVRVFNVVNYALAMTNWANIENLIIEGFQWYGAGVGGFAGGARGGRIANVYGRNALPGGAKPQSNGVGICSVGGIDMQLSNFSIDSNLTFGGTVKTYDPGTGTITYYPKNLHIYNGQVLAPGTLIQDTVNPPPTGFIAGNHRIENVKYAGALHDVNTNPDTVGAVFPLDPSALITESANQTIATYARTFKGGAVSVTPRSVTGGMDLRGEPLMGTSGLSGPDTTTLTLLASAARTTDGIGTAIDLGTPGKNALIRLLVSASSGTDRVLTVTLETSVDNVVFTSMGKHQFTANGVSFIPLRFTERYLRLSWTITGSTPSFTFISDLELQGWANNLSGVQAITTSATTGTVAFPGLSFGPSTNGISGLAQAVRTGGTLVPGTTYHYRVGAAMRRRGPVTWSNEASILISGSNNSTSWNHQKFHGGGPRGFYTERYIILRGTAANNYTHRYEAAPLPNVITFQVKGSSDTWVDYGTEAQKPTLLTGFQILFPVQSGSWTNRNESGDEPDTAYRVIVTPSWLTTYAVTAKRRDGFDLSFGIPAPAGATVDWMLVR